MSEAYDLQDKIKRVDSYFRSMNIHKEDIVGQKKDQEPLPEGNYNSRGEVMLSPKEIRQNYGKALYFFKWYQIPLCRKSIKHKIKFWAPASVVMAWTYGQYVKKKQPDNMAKVLPFRFYLRSFGVFFTLTSIYSIWESLTYDEFCDIDSPYYQENESRLSMAKRIRSQMKTKDGGIFTSVFG